MQSLNNTFLTATAGKIAIVLITKEYGRIQHIDHTPLRGQTCCVSLFSLRTHQHAFLSVSLYLSHAKLLCALASC